MIAQLKRGPLSEDIEFLFKKKKKKRTASLVDGVTSCRASSDKLASRVMEALRRHCALLVLLFCIHNYLLVSAFSKSELLFPFGDAASDQSLVNETDDFNSVEIPLTTPVIFYDQVFSSIYVSYWPFVDSCAFVSSC